MYQDDVAEPKKVSQLYQSIGVRQAGVSADAGRVPLGSGSTGAEVLRPRRDPSTAVRVQACLHMR